MPRSVQITVPPAQTEALLRRLDATDDVIAITVNEGAGYRPAGDVVTVRGTNDMAESVIRIVTDMGLTELGSVRIDEPVGLISGEGRRRISHDSSEATWEEMDTMLRRDTNPSRNYLAMMMLAGVIAGIGLALDRLHIVVGAMLVAPGFEPLVRIAFGLTCGLADTAKRGVISVGAGYGLMAAGGAFGTILAVWAGAAPSLDAVLDQQWVQYWASVKWTSILTGIFAGIAGAVVVNSHQTVFATGVMVALALIPGMAIFGLALLAGDLELALRGLGRWAADALCVLATSFLIFGIKRAALQRRANP